jgi:hypothetical protein
MSVEVRGIGVGLATALDWTYERLVPAVNIHVLPELLDVGHDHPASELVLVFVHMCALKNLVRLPLGLVREHIEQIVLALRYRDFVQAKEHRVEVFAVHNRKGLISVDTVLVHELWGEDLGTVWLCKTVNQVLVVIEHQDVQLLAFVQLLFELH